MKKPVMLKCCRSMEKRVSQKELADAVGISERMVDKLEHDEEPWKTMRSSTKNKLNEYFKDVRGWEPLEAIEGAFDPDKLIKKEKVENTKTEPESEPKITIERNNELADNDTKVLTLIEFAYEGLSEATNHTEFMVNINLMKRILNKFNF